MELVVDLKIGGHAWPNLPFIQAVEMVKNYTEIEEKSCNYLVNKINADHWIVSFWSELLGGRKPPAHSEWAGPISELKIAEDDYRRGLADRATGHLKIAVIRFKDVHRKWLEYRGALDEGGNMAVDIIQFTIRTLSTVAGGYAGGIVKGAVLSTGIKAFTTASTEVGMKAQGVEQKNPRLEDCDGRP